MADLVRRYNDGEPLTWYDNEVRTFCCCDCGLVHQIIIEIEGNKVFLRFYRDKYLTQRLRILKKEQLKQILKEITRASTKAKKGRNSA